MLACVNRMRRWARLKWVSGLRAWLARDDASYVEFVRTRSAALYRLAMLLTGGDHHLAEDLLQAALTKAYVSWSGSRAGVRRGLRAADPGEHRRVAEPLRGGA